MYIQALCFEQLFTPCKAVLGYKELVYQQSSATSLLHLLKPASSADYDYTAFTLKRDIYTVARKGHSNVKLELFKLDHFQTISNLTTF